MTMIDFSDLCDPLLDYDTSMKFYTPSSAPANDIQSKIMLIERQMARLEDSMNDFRSSGSYSSETVTQLGNSAYENTSNSTPSSRHTLGQDYQARLQMLTTSETDLVAATTPYSNRKGYFSRCTYSDIDVRRNSKSSINSDTLKSLDCRPPPPAPLPSMRFLPPIPISRTLPSRRLPSRSSVIYPLRNYHHVRANSFSDYDTLEPEAKDTYKSANQGAIRTSLTSCHESQRSSKYPPVSPMKKIRTPPTPDDTASIGKSSRFKQRAVSITNTSRPVLPCINDSEDIENILASSRPTHHRMASSSCFPSNSPSYTSTQSLTHRRPSASANMPSRPGKADQFQPVTGFENFTLNIGSPQRVCNADTGIVVMESSATDRVFLGLGSGSDKADKVLGIEIETCTTPKKTSSVKKTQSWKIKKIGNLRMVLDTMTGGTAKEKKKVREEWSMTYTPTTFDQ